ncbi:MFS transporter [Salipiger aestuarii]|uniref:Putative MFS family arabinose efflux permease n=1 Tax=Salipiger aestuarii TaxID=568098 RepID=A0A327Y0Z5_9RHOB|nr:MFS transporter [Salipiger aestuarii]EIE52369.1 major facilitator transporter [Citreicella sp. 357]KAA8605449.1 MFS transporter [Salipiger aestuarii]KAA8607181.1 MFS transporter [Salipiger aestuarii]KAB2539355.1 MFS transporter [Salipiger aestuarii]RAK14051.1 putative MFS family arabinose efflux permease [Salipiger aestuarii]
MSLNTPEIGETEPVAVSLRSAILGPIAANVAYVVELTLVPLLLPAIQLQLNLSIGDLAWVFNAYGIAVAGGVLLGGFCGDAYDTRKVFALGVAFFAAGSLVVSASESFESLIAGRALQGFGGGIFSPLVPLLLTRATQQKPGRTLIVWGSIAGYVAAFAPLFYGRFLGGYSWNLAFAFIAVVAGAALVILTRTRAAVNPAPYPRSAKDYANLVRTRDLWVTFAYVFCTYGSITYYLFRIPVLLADYEVSATSVGLILSIVWLTFSALSTLLRNMVDKPHIRTIMVAAPLLIAVGLPLSSYSDNLLILVLSPAFIGGGLACSNAPSTQLILKFAPKGMSAIAMSLDITFARLGGILTVALLAEAEVAYAALAICFSCFVAAFCALTACKTAAVLG